MNDGKNRLLIPVYGEILQYYEAYIKANEIECPAGISRKTSGECPLYFAGGKCRKCKTPQANESAIIHHWTCAIAAKLKELADSSGPASGNPSNSTNAEASPVICGKCINGFPGATPEAKILCLDLRQKDIYNTMRENDFSCGQGVLRGPYMMNDPEPAEGKFLLQVAHYRTVEIDCAEIDELVSIIKRNGIDICEDTVVQTFFKFTKNRLLNGASRCLNDSEVMALWKQFKWNSSCLLQKEDR